MINLSNRLQQDLTIVELIKLLKSAPGDISNPTTGYILVPASQLSEASKASRDTISYCEEHQFIEVRPAGKKCYEFRVTEKGLAFLRSQPKSPK